MKKNQGKFFVIGLAVVAVCVGVGSYSFVRYSRERDEAQQVTEEVKIEEGYVETEANLGALGSKALSGSKTSKAAEKYVSPVDFDSLEKTNPDVKAWINVPGTKIDYPIMQHPTNDGYYLKHGMNGMTSSHGCPYIELSDSGDFTEFNTVVYGHNMKDGSMFAGLHSYEDKTFYDEHRQVKVYTREHEYTYKVFGAVMYSDAHIPYFYNDTFESDRTAFLKSLSTDSVAERSYISQDVKVTEDDCIITLSTCDPILRNNRYLVLAVLTEIDGKSAGIK